MALALAIVTFPESGLPDEGPLLLPEWAQEQQTAEAFVDAFLDDLNVTEPGLYSAIRGVGLVDVNVSPEGTLSAMLLSSQEVNTEYVADNYGYRADEDDEQAWPTFDDSGDFDGPAIFW